jgi:hypothetical protein
VPERIDTGAIAVAAGAIVLVVSLFLHWFQPALTGWDSFEVLDLLLAVLALLCLAAVLPGITGRPSAGAGVPPEWLPWLGLAALLIVVEALIDHPPAAGGRSVAGGAWVALAGAALMGLGGLLRIARVSLVITLRPAGPSESRPPVGPAPHEPTAPLPASPEPADETETRPLPSAERLPPDA